jgi:hypothetical protein
VLAQFKLDGLIAPTNSIAWKIDLLDGDHFLGGSSTPTLLAGYPAHQRTGRLLVRAADRHHIHGHRFHRAEADQNRRRLRGGHQSPEAAQFIPARLVI